MKTLIWVGILSSLALAAAARQEMEAKHAAAVFALACAGGDCVLLKGTPQTGGMRGGSVQLKPGESVGWHSTGENEEALTILHGSGAAKVDGQPDLPIHEQMLVYIPPGTRHNVTAVGSEPLEYVWVVAPVKK